MLHITSVIRGSGSGIVQWYDDVELTSPTTTQCKDIMNHLKKEQQKEWNIWFYTSSTPESAMITISNLYKCPVKGLIIHDIPLDSNCITML